MKTSIILVLLLIVSACSTIAKQPISTDAQAIVAKDFVNSLSQLRGASPRDTTIQTYSVNKGFGEQLISELRTRGYGIQLVPNNAPRGAMHISYQSHSFENNETKSVTFRVRMGSTELSREYEIRGERVFPITALSVVGINAENVAVDNSIFEQPVTVKPVLNPQPFELDELKGAQPMSRELKPAQVTPIKQNVNELGRSNFEGLFSDYKEVKNSVIIFGNDSLRMGNSNKKRLRAFVREFNAATDLVSVTGCSHGKTSLVNGNEYLATGRANRVKEELLLLDISANHILDEVCWASNYVEPMPRKGVVVSLLRKSA